MTLRQMAHQKLAQIAGPPCYEHLLHCTRPHSLSNQAGDGKNIKIGWYASNQFKSEWQIYPSTGEDGLLIDHGRK